jgi:hypothetical protein
MCCVLGLVGGPVAVAREMEIRAGLRCEGGRERRRVRRAVPRVQAVSVVKVRKR